MPDALVQAAAMLGIEPVSDEATYESRAAVEKLLGRRLPYSVARLLRYPGIMDAAANVYDSDPQFPGSPQLLEIKELPSVENDTLWLMSENQGVCFWGVPLGAGDDPPVMVFASALESGATKATYAKTVGEFVLACAWDKRLLVRKPLIQAQADAMDQQTLESLDARYFQRVRTLGWPARENRRYEAEDGLMLSIWSGGDQCDWWLSAADDEALERAIGWLRHQSNLERAMWSNDQSGIDMLKRLDVKGPWGS